MNHQAICSNATKDLSVDHPLIGRAYLLLVVCMLMPTIKGFGQGGPIGLMEVKSKIETYSLTDLNAEIEKRGISFVLTDGVKAQLKNKVKDFRNDDPEGLQRLLGLIKEREPKELVVAIAGFQGGNG